MKSYSYLLFCIVIILCTNILIGQHSVENVEPTVSQFQKITEGSDPGYTGALNYSIPLISIPNGRGEGIDINLNYVHGNGVPASEAA